MKFYVYILFSVSRDVYYVGFTGNSLKERIREHNTNHAGLKGYIGEWMLMHFETFNTKADAESRAIQINKWKSRKRIEQLINSDVLDQ